MSINSANAFMCLSRCVRRQGANALLLGSLLLCATMFAFAQDVVFEEYALGNPLSPTGITPGPDGALWFALSGAVKVGRITTDGTITEYSLPTLSGSPEFITTGPDGALWFTKAYSNQIGRITTSGVIEEYELPNAGSYPLGIAAGPDGALWFTEFQANRIGRITTSGLITEYPTQYRPNMITAGPDGALWFTAGDHIGRITTSGAITEYPLPVNNYGIGITSGPDGRIWFADYGTSSIGAITTGGSVTEYPVTSPPPPSGSINLAGITTGPDGALWFTELDANRIGRITTAGKITEYTVPTPESSPGFISSGPDGALWFTEETGQKIGKIVIPNVTNKSATSTTLVSSPNPSIYGQTVTLAAMVTSADSSTPTGNVVFKSSQLGRSFTIGTAALNAGGVATLARSNLGGSYVYPITAVYLGDSLNVGSSSAVLNQVVKQTTTAASLTSLPNPSVQGQAVTFRAKITSPTVIAKGPVTFSMGNTVLGTAQLSAGNASLTVSALPSGLSVIKVTYYGNSNIAKSSATVIQTVH